MTSVSSLCYLQRAQPERCDERSARLFFVEQMAIEYEEAAVIAALRQRQATQEVHDARHRAWQQIEPQQGALPRVEKVFVLGTGPSEGTPNIGCVTDPSSSCESCAQARVGSLDRRRQPCVIVRIITEEGNKHILIDCGPGFREAAIDFFPRYGIRKLDAVLLTHGHADHMCALSCARTDNAATASTICGHGLSSA